MTAHSSVRSLLRVLVAASILSAAPAFAQEAAPAPAAVDPAAIVATIGGQPVTEADLALVMNELAQQFEQVPEEKKRAAALQALIEIRLVAAKARAAGAGDTDEFKRQIALLTDRLLHQGAIDRDIAAKITDEDVRKRYDQEVAARPAENEVKARHILVKTEEEAKKLIAELDGGADFEKLAAAHTTDPSGKETGGDLGYFGAGMMVPEFEKAAFETAPGSYTKTAVKTQFGFHIIKVEDKRTKQPPEFDTVKDQVRAIVLRERYLEEVKTLRTAAAVEITDAALKADIDAQK
jgi:peptidyl-prolyl cis-trans isomerase C